MVDAASDILTNFKDGSTESIWCVFKSYIQRSIETFIPVKKLGTKKSTLDNQGN